MHVLFENELNFGHLGAIISGCIYAQSLTLGQQKDEATYFDWLQLVYPEPSGTTFSARKLQIN